MLSGCTCLTSTIWSTRPWQRNATHTGRHMGLVVKIDVIRKAVNFHPRNRLAG